VEKVLKNSSSTTSKSKFERNAGFMEQKAWQVINLNYVFIKENPLAVNKRVPLKLKWENRRVSVYMPVNIWIGFVHNFRILKKKIFCASIFIKNFWETIDRLSKMQI
jgi:hypothetical protein